MRSLAYINEEYRKALIDTHKIVSRSVLLPLAGDSELIVITHKQSLDYDEISEAMGLSAVEYEELLGLPFPFSDIILLISEPGRGGNLLGSNTSSYLVLDCPVDIRSIYHLMADFYLDFSYNRWISAGAADFLATKAEISAGTTTMERRMASLEEGVRYSCDATIQDSLMDWGSSVCDYWLGERLLWNMSGALGEETMAAGLKSLALAFREGPVSDEIFYAIFLKNTPPNQRENFRGVYEEYHGGPVPGVE